MNDKLYDVIIYEIETGIVDTIAGHGMRKSTGFHNAEKRLNMVLGRINDSFDAVIVETGKYRKGDIFR